MTNPSQNAFERTIEKFESMLSPRTVVGEATSANGTTVIPLFAAGFGFGFGGAFDIQEPKPEQPHEAGGAGGSGGLAPVALVVIDKDGHVRVERVRGGLFRALVETMEEAAMAAANVASRPAKGSA